MGVKLGKKVSKGGGTLVHYSFVLHGVMGKKLSSYRGWKIKTKLMVNVTSLGVGFVFF
jgi:hypothetical protein